MASPDSLPNDEDPAGSKPDGEDTVPEFEFPEWMIDPDPDTPPRGE